MAKEPRIEFTVAGERVIVDFEKLDGDLRDLLEDKVLDVRMSKMPQFKYPYEEGETEEKWKERVSKLAEEEFMRKEGESVEDHLKRMYSSKETSQIVYGIFNAVSECFCGKTFAPEQLKKCSWPRMKKFLYDVLTYCGIAAGDLRPQELGK